MSLTDTEVKRAKEKAKTYRMSDGGNMFLWVTPSGGKLWRWKYEFAGKGKTMALGKYPAVTLAQARERHAAGHKMLANGVDPMAERKAEKIADQVSSENSFARVAAKWLDHWKDNKSERYVDSTRRRLDSNILPSLGPLQMDKIGTPQIVTMVKAIEARGVGDLAKRTLGTAGQIFRYAIANGYASQNPASAIRPADILKPTIKTNHPRVDARELPELLRKIEVYRGTHVTRLAIKLMTLTFLRTSELIEAPWSEFDLEKARWDVPAKRMKMKTQHIVPLARQVIEILVLLRELTGDGDLLFPGAGKKNRTMSNNTR